MFQFGGWINLVPLLKRFGPRAQFVLFLVAFFTLWTLRATWLIRIDQSIQSPETKMAFATLMKVLMWALPAVLFGYWVRKEYPVSYLGLSTFPRPQRWGICLLAIVAFGVLVLSFELLIGRKGFSFGTPSMADFPAKVAIFVISPFIEEILFRGLVLKELSSLMRNGMSNLVASILFVGVHLPYWISSGMQPQEIASTSIGILLFSLFAGWLYSFTKSIWPPTSAHVANNVLSSLIG